MEKVGKVNAKTWKSESVSTIRMENEKIVAQEHRAEAHKEESDYEAKRNSQLRSYKYFYFRDCEFGSFMVH